jgi:hypothetical protein
MARGENLCQGWTGPDGAARSSRGSRALRVDGSTRPGKDGARCARWRGNGSAGDVAGYGSSGARLDRQMWALTALSEEEQGRDSVYGRGSGAGR